MKRFLGLLLSAIMFMAVSDCYAQTSGDDATAEYAKKKYDLRPEFTARGYMGFYNNGYRISGGVNINDKRTVGLMLGYHGSYHDYAPGDVYSITTALYYRRYFHLGKRKKCAFYIDAYAGAGWVYKVDEWFADGAEKQIDEEPGDALFVAGIQPGFRVCLYKNLHIFLGPSIATDCIGVHLGIGF